MGLRGQRREMRMSRTWQTMDKRRREEDEDERGWMVGDEDVGRRKRLSRRKDF